MKYDTAPFLAPDKFQEGRFLSSNEIHTLSTSEKLTPYLIAALDFIPDK